MSIALFITLIQPPSHAQQPPTTTPEEGRIYEALRAWITAQPPEVQRADDDVVYQRYAAALQAEGKPNAFLVDMIKGLRPGRALDVGMGQGRNTIFLAQQGWDAVGFDPADRAVAAAREQAGKLGVKIMTHVARAEDFEWGDGQWDLIVLSYVGGREYVANVVRALRPGGMVLIDAFHRDATKKHPIGGAVVFDTNELLKLYGALRVVRYEDTDGVGDFGMEPTRVVRLFAQKPGG